MENKTPNPPCKIYNVETGIWQEFKSIIILVNGYREIFKYENTNTKSELNIIKKISYDYIAYYSKYIPSKLQKKIFSDLKLPDKKIGRPSNSGDEINGIIVLENLEKLYLSVDLEVDQYILLGFQMETPEHDETNRELKFIRSKISHIHFQLKYSKYGIRCQISRRILKIIYKSLKYCLCYISELCNTPSAECSEAKIRILIQNFFDLGFQEFILSILDDKKFHQEAKSIVYKSLILVGLFPAYVELNTMNESNLFLTLKSIFSTPVNAPYGSKHHAAFAVGNLRYSFINDPTSKDNQRISKVRIYPEQDRGFNIKSQQHEYFRLKLFDFFPMDSWIEMLSKEIITLLRQFITDASSDYVSLCEDARFKEFLELFVANYYTSRSRKLSQALNEVHGNSGFDTETIKLRRRDSIKLLEPLHEKIARLFWDRYKPELDEKSNEMLFKRMVHIILDAETRGYSEINNNCQTIVSEIVSLLCKQYQKIVEPLLDCRKIFSREEITTEFLKFPGKSNLRFSKIGPLSLTHRISYFETFTDKDSSEIICPKNFSNLNSHLEKFIKRKEVKDFIKNLEENLLMNTKIEISVDEKGDHTTEEFKYPEIDLETKHEAFSIISLLLNVKYNELFNIRREIKIAKSCQDKLDMLSDIIDPKEKKKKSGEKEMLTKNVQNLPELYEKKYPEFDFYKEICYYYYNSIRLGMKAKLVDNCSFIGFLLIRKPNDTK